MALEEEEEEEAMLGFSKRPPIYLIVSWHRASMFNSVLMRTGLP